MASFKIGRVQEDILRELTAIMRELKDPRITPDLTIVRADLSGDMGHCKVYVSSLTDFERAKDACRVLEKASGFIRKELFRLLQNSCRIREADPPPVRLRVYCPRSGRAR